MVADGDSTAPPALTAAGLELSRDADGAFLIRGNTFAHRDLLRAQGGDWDKARRLWRFADQAALAGLASALAAPGYAPSGLREAPTRFEGLSPAATDGRSGVFGRLLGWARGSSAQSHSPAPRSSRKPKAAPAKPPHYLGHRQRLRDRFLEGGAEALPDYELLELLLFFSIPKIDVKPLAKQLLEEFGSLGGLLAAEPERLDRIDGVGHFTIVQLKATQTLLQRALLEEVRGREVISSADALLAYLRLALGHEPIEQFRVLFLDKKNILIRDEVQQRGTVDHTPLYPREIAKRALELGAKGIIMVHNHPSGDPTPSGADLDMTRATEAALKPFDIALHDHLIIGQSRHLSFRAEALL
jgi:DNA repair protein RadC